MTSVLRKRKIDEIEVGDFVWYNIFSFLLVREVNAVLSTSKNLRRMASGGGIARVKKILNSFSMMLYAGRLDIYKLLRIHKDHRDELNYIKDICVTGSAAVLSILEIKTSYPNDLDILIQVNYNEKQFKDEFIDSALFHCEAFCRILGLTIDNDEDLFVVGVKYLVDESYVCPGACSVGNV